MKRFPIVMWSIGLFLVLATSSKAWASTITVTDHTSGSWSVQHAHCNGVTVTGSQTMLVGPQIPVIGLGSREFRIGNDGDSFETYRLSAYNGVPLSDITRLVYSTFVQQTNTDGLAPYLILSIDLDNNGFADDQLFFEPRFQTSTYQGETVPNQGAVIKSTWETWNALTGGWWSLNEGNDGPPLTTLGAYIQSHPEAKLASPASGLGSIRIATGCGGQAWSNFLGFADNLSIGTKDTVTDYDFEVTLAPPSPSVRLSVVNRSATRVSPSPSLSSISTVTASATATSSATIAATTQQTTGPSSTNQCKHGTWLEYTNLRFANESECLNYVAGEGQVPKSSILSRLFDLIFK